MIAEKICETGIQISSMTNDPILLDPTASHHVVLFSLLVYFGKGIYFTSYHLYTINYGNLLQSSYHGSSQARPTSSPATSTSLLHVYHPPKRSSKVMLPIFLVSHVFLRQCLSCESHDGIDSLMGVATKSGYNSPFVVTDTEGRCVTIEVSRSPSLLFESNLSCTNLLCVLPKTAQLLMG